MDFRLKKRCPRCNTKVESTLVICPDCKLNFQKFEQATNAVAKQKLKQGDKDQVLMRKGRPEDVTLWKLLLIAIFIGFAGGHHYYVGRYKKGVFYSVFFLIGLTYAVVTTMVENIAYTFAFELFYILVLVWGVVIFMWIIDVVNICFNKYKIPVSRDWF